MDDAERLTDALLDASRALVAVAARSLDDIGDRLTLTEIRALVVLDRVGALPVTVLAERVGVHQSTATRVAARLRRRGLVVTDKSEQDRRLTVVGLSPPGRALVQEVFARRRADIAAVVRRLGDAEVLAAHAALAAFAEAFQQHPAAEDEPAVRDVAVVDGWVL